MSQSYNRANINGTSPQDLMHMNDNFKYLWMKVFGDIDNADISDTADINGSKFKDNSISAEKIIADSITSREISSEYVYAGKINANQINVGYLNGFTIQGGSIIGTSYTLTGNDGQILMNDGHFDILDSSLNLCSRIKGAYAKASASGTWNFTGTLQQGGSQVLTSSNWSSYISIPSGNYLPSTGSTITLNGHTLQFYSDGMTYDGHLVVMNG